MHLSRQTAAEILFVVIAPVVGFFALHIGLINQDQSVDPWIYTGYGQEFPLLQQLYGWPYYAVRFPVILLNFAVPKGLDPVLGFAIVRYLVFLLCGVPFYLWARYQFGIVYAIAAYLFLFCNPLFPRLLLWDLTPFVSVPMALVGITLWLLPPKSNDINWMLANRVLAGFAFAASVAAHAFTGTAIAVFFVAEAARRLFKREYFGFVLFDVTAPIAGAVICFAIGIAFYFVILGPFDPSVIFTSTLSAIRAGDQYAASHSSEVSTWIWLDTYVFVPFLLVGFIAIGFTRDLLKDNAISRVWWFGFLYCAVYAAYQFLLHRFVLETSVYFFHLSLVVYLLFPVCLYLITRKLAPRGQTIVVSIAIAVLILTPMLVPVVLQGGLMNFEVVSIIGVILAISAVYSIGLVTTTASIVSAYAIALVVAVQILTLSAPEFSGMYSNPSQAEEYDVYRAAVEMVRLFASYASPSHRVKVWYSPEEFSITSIASTVLLDSINKNFEGDGLPAVSDYERSQIGSPELRYIMMLSINSESIAKGKDALIRNGYQFRDVEHGRIGGVSFSADFDLIELTR
jgi:hypothetical protein